MCGAGVGYVSTAGDASAFVLNIMLHRRCSDWRLPSRAALIALPERLAPANVAEDCWNALGLLYMSVMVVVLAQLLKLVHI